MKDIKENLLLRCARWPIGVSIDSEKMTYEWQYYKTKQKKKPNKCIILIWKVLWPTDMKLRILFFLCRRNKRKNAFITFKKTPFKSFVSLSVLTNNYEDIKGKSKYMYMYIHSVVQIDELTITIILFINVKIFA